MDILALDEAGRVSARENAASILKYGPGRKIYNHVILKNALYLVI